MDLDDGVAARLDAVRRAIADACRAAGRSPAEVRIVGVTKHVSDDSVAEAIGAGLMDLAENHAVALRDRAPRFPGVRWHFIGTLQSGSARLVAAHADEVQSLRPGGAVEVLERRLTAAGRRIQVLIEVDLAGRGNATPPDDLPAFADRVVGSGAFDLRGLMCVPAPDTDPAQTRAAFAGLRSLGEELRRAHPAANELSMGMSGDYTIAVEEGATMVRLGTVLFGSRAAR